MLAAAGEPPCADDEQLAALIESALGQSEAAALRRHIFACEACCQRMLAAGASLPPEPTDTGRLPLPISLAPSAAHDRPAAWEPPTQFEHFRLLRRLGQGSMGQVFVGHDGLLDRAVAIKFIAAVSPDEGARQRFMTEARAIARLLHPNVVTVHSVGQVDGHPYLVTELVRGRSLAQLERPQPSERALSIAIDLCRGLAAAHRRGVLHRDLKPANAIYSDEGGVKLLDFGLAKLVSRQHRPSSQPELVGPLDDERSWELPAPVLTASQTQRGLLLGTPLYIAPEIWLGQPASVQTDLYSLGAVLYELCTGLPPVRAGSLLELRRRALAGDIPACASQAATTDPRLAQAIDRCLARDPVARPRSAEDLLQDLLRIAPQHQRRVPDGNPFRGLHVFHAEHRALFFGRESDLTEAVERLRTQSLLVLLGDSGVGKSSLAYAAILPDVQSGALGDGRSFQTIALTPGADPQLALATALARAMTWPAAVVYQQIADEPAALARAIQERLASAAGLLIFIDQLEELVTSAQPESARRAAEFLAQLSLGWPGLRLLASLRADFLTRISALPALGRLLPSSVQLILPLDRCALRLVMTGPLQQKGYAFESAAMIEDILDAVSGDGGLPLLQFSLSMLWELRDSSRRLLPASALVQIGGPGGALAHHADLLLASLLPEQRAAARRLLCKLVSADDTRRPRPESQLVSGEAAERAALSALVQGRLVMAREASDGESCYELTHEALIRDWPTLRDWLTNEGERRAVRQRLEEAAAHWEALQRSGEALWGDAPLDDLTHTGVDPNLLGEREQAFLTRSLKARRRRRRLRRAAFVLLPLLLVVLAASAALSVQSRRSAERTEAFRQKEADLNTAMLARTPGNERQLLRQALESVAPELSTGRPLSQNALARLRSAVFVGRQSLPLVGHRQQPTWAAFSPDGTRVITTDAGERALLWETATSRRLAELPHPPDTMAYRVFYSPDGRYIAQPMLNGTLRLRDGQTGALLADLRTGKVGGYHAAFSPDSQYIAVAMGGTSTAGHEIPIWHLATRKLTQELHGHASEVDYIVYSPDGSQIASAGALGEVMIHDAKTGRPLQTFKPNLAEGKMIAFSPDNQYLLTSATDGAPMLWSVASGQIHKVLHGHSGKVLWTEFFPAGDRLITAGEDSSIRIWETASGLLLHTLLGHSQTVYAARVTPDGKRVISVGTDAETRVWDSRSGTLLQRVAHHQTAIKFAAIDPSGQYLLTIDDDLFPRLANAHIGMWGNQITRSSAVVSLSVVEDKLAVIDENGSPGNAIIAAGTRLTHTALPRDFMPSQLLGPNLHGFWLRSDSALRWYSFDQAEKSALGWQIQLAGQSPIYSRRHDSIILLKRPDTITLLDPQTGGAAASGTLRNASPCNTAQGVQLRMIAMTANRKLMAVGSMDGAVHLYQLPGFQFITAICLFPNEVATKKYQRVVQEMLFTDQLLLVLSRGGELVQVDLTTFLPQRRVALGNDGFAMHKHPSKPLIAIASHMSHIPILNIHDLSVKLNLTGHSKGFLSISFSHSGKQLASAGLDGTSRVWDTESGQLISTFEYHTGALNDVKYSADDREIFTAAQNGTVRIWDPLTGQPVQPPEDGYLLRPAVGLSDHEWKYLRESPPKSRQEPSELIQLSCRLLHYQPEYPAVAATCTKFMTPPPAQP